MKKIIILITIFVFVAGCEEESKLEKVSNQDSDYILDSLRQIDIQDSLNALDSLRQIDIQDSLNVLDSLSNIEKLNSIFKEFNRIQNYVYSPLDTIQINNILIDTFGITEFYLDTFAMPLNQNDDGQYFLEIPVAVANQKYPTYYYSLKCKQNDRTFQLADSIKTYFSRAAFSNAIISISQASFTFSKYKGKSYKSKDGPGIINESTQEFYYKESYVQNEKILSVVPKYFYGFGTVFSAVKFSNVDGYTYAAYSCAIGNNNLNLGFKYKYKYYSDSQSHSGYGAETNKSIMIQNIDFEDLLNTNSYTISIKGKNNIIEKVKEILYYKYSNSYSYGEGETGIEKLLDYEFNENSTLTITLERK